MFFCKTKFCVIVKAVAGLMLLGGCTVGPDFQKPAAVGLDSWSQLPVLQQNSTADLPLTLLEDAPEQAWWQQFDDALLSSLIERAKRHNFTLRSASSLLAQSRAMRGIAAADQFPLLNGNASYTRMQASQEGILNLSKTMAGGNGSASAASGQGSGSTANGSGVGAIGLPAAGIAPFSLYQFGLDASWEADFWGRVRRELESAQAGLEISQEQHHAAQISLIAEVATSYFELRRLQENRAALQQQLDIARQQQQLAEYRTARGAATDIELENAKLAVDNVQAALPTYTQQIEQAMNQLSLLTASEPGLLTAELSAAHQPAVMPRQVSIGLPNELAQRRPDIRQAEASLHRALANIGMATADFYPRFTLSGSSGLQALALKNLGSWSALQYAMGPSIMLPIFQGGRLSATLELRQAEHQQAAINYQNTVLSAWYEIDNNLSAYAESQRRQQILLKAVAANTQLLKLAEQRYQQGVTDYQPVLQAQALLSHAEQARIDGAGLLAANLVALYKALGGGWQVPPN